MFALQLGTSKIKLYKKGKGIVYSGATALSFDKSQQDLIALGNEALSMIDKTPSSIEVTTPIISGSIVDYTAIKNIISSMIEKYSSDNIMKPKILIVVPGTLTNLEKKTIIDIACFSGAEKVSLIPSPIASAYGIKLDIKKPYGNLIIDIGAGTTDIAAISMDSIVFSETLKIGGNDIDEAIIQYIKRTKNFIIGKQTAEKIKKSIGFAMNNGEEIELFVVGKNTLTDLPEYFSVSSNEINEAITPVLNQILDSVRIVMEQLPAQMYTDICSGQLYVTGGSAQLKNLALLFEDKLHIPTLICSDSENTAIKGAGYLLNNIDTFEDEGFLFKLRHQERFRF